MPLVSNGTGENQGSSTTPNVTRPSGATSGRLALAFIGAKGGMNVAFNAIPSGWVQIPNARVNQGTNLAYIPFYKILGGSEPSSYTWTFTGSARVWAIQIRVYSPFNASEPIDITSGQANSTNTNSTAPSITTRSDNEDIIFVSVLNRGLADGSHTPPATINGTELETNSGTSNTHVSLASADGIAATAGATGTKIGVWTQADLNIGALIALLPDVTTKTASDSGTLTDGAAVAAATTGASESGTFSEFGAISLPGTDAGSVADDLAGLAAALATTDSGTFSDSGLITAEGTQAIVGSDDGVLTETAAIDAALTSIDSGTFTDTGTIEEQTGVTVTATDAGTLSETVAIAAITSGSDSSSLSETDAIAAALSGSDSGVLTDSGTVEEQAPGTVSVAGTDSGTLTDTGLLAAAATTTESATLADAGTMAVSATTTESATLTEYGAISLPGADSGTTTDNLAGLDVVAAAAEVVALYEARLIAAELETRTDSGLFNELATISIYSPSMEAPFIQTPTRAVPTLDGRTRTRLTTDGTTRTLPTSDGKTRVEV